MIETKQIYLNGITSKKYIEDMTAFGWQPTQETSERHGRYLRYYQIMARDTSMYRYEEHCKFEKDYETAKSKIKTYDPMEFTTVLLLLLIFVVPGVIYIAFKVNQKKEINENNQNCYIKMRYAVNAAKNIK